MTIRTRFAPSPTGFIHIGNIRTALFSWLYAKKYNGEFIIRIDDTDQERNSSIYTENIINILNWLEIKSNQKIIFQSNRLARYKDIIQTLLEEKKVYKCYCTKDRLDLLKKQQLINKKKIKYDGKCKEVYNENEDFVIRINTEKYENVSFYDRIKGNINFSIDEIDDFIISKKKYHPTYNLASVIDDIDLKITDVIRGDDHISNTPKQIMLFNLLNSKIPSFSHLPMILNENKKPLSKRDKESRIDYYKIHGFLPEALLNYIVKLGWSNKNKEIFSIDEMINLFNIENISSSPSILNNSKLIWLNKHYIKTSSTRYLIEQIIPIEKKFNLNYMIGPNLTALIDINKHKVSTLEEIITKNIFLYKNNIKISDNLINIYFSNEIIKILKYIYIEIKNMKECWNIDIIKKIIMNTITLFKIDLNKIATAIRILITGENNPNSLYDIIFLSGKILLLKKIRNIIKQYENGVIAQLG